MVAEERKVVSACMAAKKNEMRNDQEISGVEVALVPVSVNARVLVSGAGGLAPETELEDRDAIKNVDKVLR